MPSRETPIENGKRGEHPFDPIVPLGAIGEGMAERPQAVLDHQVPDAVVLRGEERLAAEEVGQLQGREVLAEVGEEPVTVGLG
jgi:hypothetical protein